MLIADSVSPEDVAAIATARDTWLRSINLDDVQTMMAVGTDDMVAFPPHESPLRGLEANTQWHRARIEQFRTHLTLDSEEIQGGSVWAFERFSYTITLIPRAGGAAIQNGGTCFWTWQRQSDGRWKVARAIWNSDSPLPGVATEADAAAIRRVADDYTAAVNAGSVDGLAATLAPDIVVMPPDAPMVSGIKAVRDWFKTQFVDPFHVNLTFSFTELDVRGDVAVAYGPFELALTPRAGGPVMAIAGKYIDVYERQPDSSWKFAKVIFNSDAPVVA